MNKPTIQQVFDLYRLRGHAYFSNDERPFNLNIFGIRNPNPEVNKFGCWLGVFWKYKGKWEFRVWPATTYPGKHWLKNPMNRKGAGILVPGRYEKTYQLDIHNGKYEALCQRLGPVRVYRDNDRDDEFDLDPATIDTGRFGINIHAPVTPRNGIGNYVQDLVNQSSAGCQVTQSVSDFLELRSIAQQAVAYWGNAFTYTLLMGVGK